MNLPTRYDDLSPSERRQVRDEYVRQQNGKCWMCQQPLDGPPRKDVLDRPYTDWMFPPNFLKWPVHLHHDHETGMTEGAVHAKCNAVLWEYYGE